MNITFQNLNLENMKIFLWELSLLNWNRKKLKQNSLFLQRYEELLENTQYFLLLRISITFTLTSQE